MAGCTYEHGSPPMIITSQMEKNSKSFLKYFFIIKPKNELMFIFSLILIQMAI